MRIKWDDEKIEYIKTICENRKYADIADMVNEKFGINANASMISSAMKKRGIKSGYHNPFPKGHTPWNKGTKGVMKANSTTWKKGSRSGAAKIKYRELYAERIDKDDYVVIKIKEPNTWQLKHRWVYEKHHGKIPRGNKVIFLDGNNRNFNIDNLALVSNSEMMIINKNDLRYDNAELTEVGVNIAKVLSKVSKLK